MHLSRKKLKDGIVNVVLATLAVVGFCCLPITAVVSLSNHTLAQQVHTLEQRSVVSSNRHHAQNVKQNAAIAAQNKVILRGEYIIGSLLNEVIAAQADGHQTLDEIQTQEQQAKTLQTEFNSTVAAAVPALNAGQNALLAKIDQMQTEVNAVATEVQTLLEEQAKTASQ